MKTDILVYDISEDSEYPNPSNRLRSVAIRINLSVWILPSDRIPWNLLNEFSENGVRWHLVPQSEEGSTKLIEMAMDSLNREINEAVKRAEKSVEKAGEAFVKVKEDEESKGGDLERAERKHRYSTTQTLKNINTLLRDVETAAKAFNLDLESLPLSRAKSKADALQVSAHNRAKLFAEMTAKVKGTEMEQAALEDGVPPEILADYLEERGEDVSAVRAAF